MSVLLLSSRVRIQTDTLESGPKVEAAALGPSCSKEVFPQCHFDTKRVICAFPVTLVMPTWITPLPAEVLQASLLPLV